MKREKRNKERLNFQRSHGNRGELGDLSDRESTKHAVNGSVMIETIKIKRSLSKQK